MKERVVVTGMGAITPIGNNIEDFWNGIKAGKIGFGKITAFDTSNFKTSLAAEVKNFNAADHMDKRAARRMELFCQYAVAASREAIENAGLDMEREDPFRVGVCVSSSVGSLQIMERKKSAWWKKDREGSVHCLSR